MNAMARDIPSPRRLEAIEDDEEEEEEEGGGLFA